MLASLACLHAWAAVADQGKATGDVPQPALHGADLTVLGLKEALPRIAENNPSNALYGAYSLFGSFNEKQPQQASLLLRAGTSLGANNFELSGDISHDWHTSVMSQRLLYARFQREFFDQRLRLSAGRLSSSGFSAYSSAIDGVRLQRFSSDEQGTPRYSSLSTIKGFNSVAGVLMYTVGNQVLREFPLPAGPFELHSSLFDGLPAGGTLEVRQLDGKVLPLNSAQFTAFAGNVQLQEGELEWSVAMGAARATANKSPRFDLSGKYGVSDDLTAGMDVSGSASAATYQGQLTYRLPQQWGGVGLTAATHDQKGMAVSPGEYRVYYRGRANSAYYSLDVTRNTHGGIPSELDTGALYTVTKPMQSVAMSLGGPLARGISANLQLSRQNYADHHDSVSGLNLSFSLGQYGSLNLYVQRTLASDQGGSNTVSVTWLIPLSGGGTLFTAVQKSKIQAPQYSLGYSLTDSVTFDADRQLQLTAGTDGASAVASYIGNTFATSGGISRSSSGNTSAYASVSGGAVYMPETGLIMARSIANPLVVVKTTPAAGDASVYVGSSTKPVAQLSQNQAAVLPVSLPTYKRNHLRLEDSGERLGLEMPDTLTAKAFYPNRAYLLKIDPKTLRPARMYLIDGTGKALGNGGVAALGNNLLPVEGDSSVYIENLDDVAAGPFTVNFFEEYRKPLVCALSATDLKPSTNPEFTTRNLKDVTCTEQ